MIRAAAVALAVAASAFFALSVRQATSAASARSRLDAGAPAQRTRTLLDHAGTLNPDRGIDILRARLALQTRDDATARRLLLGVVRAEPANAEAWTVIALAFPGLEARAQAALRRLEPPVRAP